MPTELFDTLESVLPDLEAECAAKVAFHEQQLHEQREALAFVRGIAAQAAVQLKRQVKFPLVGEAKRILSPRHGVAL